MYLEQQELILCIECSFQVSFISFNLEQLAPQSFQFSFFYDLDTLEEYWSVSTLSLN